MGVCIRMVALVASMCFAWASGIASQSSVPNASIQRVIGMLDNLVAEMEAEQAADDKSYAEFSKWCERQQAATSASIETLQASIEELTAQLARLYAEKADLEVAIKTLNEQITETQTQMTIATEKRGEEHQSFQTEQANFEASIAACGRAVEVLKAHYGEPAQPAQKPSWMALVQSVATVRHAVVAHKVKVHPRFMSFLQSTTSANPYQDSRGEADGIVGQMQELADTFRSDKQSSIDEENRLQEMYDKLMQEKTTLLNTLTAERDSRQKVLNQVNVDIATTEGAKAADEGSLADEQAYLAQTVKLCTDTKALYEMRTHDRTQETMAVNEAKKVLAPQAGAALVEVGSTHTTKANQLARLRGKAGSSTKASRCKHCPEAAALLSEAARTYSSEVLATAAAAMMGNEALAEIIGALDGLIKRLDEDQEMEDKHKEWCEAELAETTQRKAHHEMLVETLSQKIADLTETIAEKHQALQENAAAIQTADKNFAEATAIRKAEHEDFVTELANYVEALNALNQAIDILSKFYASKGGAAAVLVQSDASIAPREMAPGVFSNVYEQKGGKGVVEMIATVRTEFETGKADLEKAEKQAEADYQQARVDYEKMRRDLVTQGDRLTVEKQTAEGELDQAKEDKETNEQEVAAAQAYLTQLGGSCDTLLKNYDSRKEQRKEEKTAIEQAKKVLEEEA